jgi:hypothetical protein
MAISETPLIGASATIGGLIVDHEKDMTYILQDNDCLDKAPYTWDYLRSFPEKI